jgi:hypothetical protein
MPRKGSLSPCGNMTGDRSPLDIWSGDADPDVDSVSDDAAAAAFEAAEFVASL